MKVCRGCNIEKELDSFHLHKEMRDGRINYCRECRSEYIKDLRSRVGRYDTSEVYRRGNLKRNYGITLEEYDEMLESQCGVCAICGQTETRVRMGKLLPLAVDHDHRTNEIRGLLCGACNTGLGSFKDDIDMLRSAIEYLEDN